MGAIPSEYFMYYYFTDEIVDELQAKPTTRAEDILASVPGYWQHYREQLERDRPELDPDRSRGGIHELELAIDAMDAVFNDRGEVLPVNVPNRGRAVPDLGEEVVVEVPGRCGADWIEPLPQPPLPRHVRGLVEMLAEYQVLAARGGLERHARGRRPRAGRQPAGALRGEGRAALRRARRGAPRAPAGAVGRVILGRRRWQHQDARRRGPARRRARRGGPRRARATSTTRRAWRTPSPSCTASCSRRWTRAGVDASELRGAGLSLAGADWDEDFEVHRAAAERALPGVPATIVNDAIGPIRVLGRDGPAASMMCGTGAAIGARGADGSVFSLGFTPRSGSAHGLGREALSAVQEADMGDAPPTDLTRRILLRPSACRTSAGWCASSAAATASPTSRRSRRSCWRRPTRATRWRSTS